MPLAPTMTVRLSLFGSPAIETSGETVTLPLERRHQLLALLALKRCWVGRTELAALFWPAQETKRAYANLRKLLFRMQSLPWARSIEVQGGALRFMVKTDLLDFESALREQRITDALPIRRGELLAGFDDDSSEAWSSWLSFERDRLRSSWRDAALRRLSDVVDAAEAIDLTTRLLDADPLDEVAMRAHVSWLGRSGQSLRARNAYRDFVNRLAQDLGLAPSAELRALHDSLDTSIPTFPFESPESAKLEEHFIGRTVELRRIGALLAQDDCRLLCLLGPGGVGKTRLATRAIHEFAPRFPDGVAFVPLEDVSSTSELGAKLARELGVDVAGSDGPLEQVVAFLRARQMLIVLDNFEHLVADASTLSALLNACVQLKIIVTSRVRLAVSSEWLMPLEGLPCPEIEDQDRLEAFDAARLFVQAARRVAPALLPAAEAASIVDICRQVEGLPLALELAAAWTRVLSCDAIAVELRSGTDLLNAVDAAQPTRHASIEVVFEQSWRLLSAIERDALSRLSVFHGGFSAEAARAVAGASLPVLGALIDKSLLRKEGGRLFMHPLVQQLAAVRFCDGEARRSTEQAHARYFHRLLAQSRRAVKDGDREALQRVDVEFENCRVAWRWSVAHGETGALTKSVPTMLRFFDLRSRRTEGLRLLHDALESQSGPADPTLVPLLLGSIAHLEYRLDRYADAEASASRALAASRHDEHDTKLQCFKVLGSCCLRLGRHADAKRFFRKALQEAQASIDPSDVAAMLDNLALVEKVTGHYAEAQRLAVQSLAQHQRLGDFAGEALCLNNLAALHLDKQEYEPVDEYVRQGLVICDRHGFVNTRALLLANKAELAVKTGDSSADIHTTRALEIAEATGNRASACALKLMFARLALRRGDYPAARSEIAESLSIALAIGRSSFVLLGVSCFAEVLAAQGESECARVVLTFAKDHPSTGAPLRDEIRTQLAQWRETASSELPWPGLELDELAHRIVIESSIAHAPLITALLGGN